MSLTSQLLKKVFDRRNISKKLGVSHSMYYKWLEGERNPLDRTLNMLELEEGDRIIDFLCDQKGGYFTKYEEGESQDDLHSNLGKALKETSDVYTVASEVAADGKISIKEADKLEKEVTEAYKAFTGFLQKAKNGKWDK